MVRMHGLSSGARAVARVRCTENKAAADSDAVAAANAGSGVQHEAARPTPNFSLV